MRALARNPDRADDLREAGCEVRQADALEPETLGPALEGADVAYYLVHSMGRGAAGDFEERERQGARNFAEMTKRGLEPPIFRSANLPGGDEFNAKLLERYRNRVKDL